MMPLEAGETVTAEPAVVEAEAQEVTPVKSRRRPEEPTAKEVADHNDLH